MADKILKQNKIPGCERLTRPEEIKALSKYLRHIKKDLENRTDLEETTLEIPGKTTGQFHDVSELPTEYDKLDSGNSIQHLSNERIGLEGSVENINLEDHKEKLENTLNPELSEYKEKLEDLREPNLSTYKENLEDNRDLELSDHKETIENSRETELEDHKELLSEINEIEALYDSIIGLENISEPKLSDYKDTIEDNRNTNLEDYKENLEDTREPNLSTYKENLEDNRDLELSDHKDSIVDERELELSDYKETIENTTDSELSDYKDSIVDEREPELENRKETIENLKEPELSNFKDTIINDKELDSIPNFKDKIFNEREISLGDYKDSILDERELELGDYKDSILDERNPELEDYKDSILDERNPELEDYKDPLGEINEVESLYDSAIGLDDFRNPELEDYKDSIVDEREPELSNFKDTIQDDNEPSLEDYINQLDEGEFKNPVKPNTNLPLNQGEFKNPIKPTNNLKRPANENQIFNNEWNTDGSPGYYGSWDDVIPKLVDEREPELEDTVILKDAAYNSKTGTFSTDGLARVDDGYDYLDNSINYNDANPLIQQKAKQKFERHQEVLEKPANENPIFNNEWNDDGSPGYYGSWDDVIPKLTDDREPELSEEKIEKPLSENPSPIYDQLLNLPENDLYNLVLQLLGGNSTLVNQDAEWNQKIASIVSTYLQPQDERDSLIQPQNAHRFEEELFRSINLVGVERDQGGEYRSRIDTVQGGMSRNSDGTARIDGNYDFIDIYTSDLKAEQNRAERHTKDKYKYVPLSDIPQSSTKLMIEYIRYLAEQSVGVVDGNSVRKYLLEEVLWTLILTRRITEKKTEINRDRLPGHSIYNGVGTLIDEIYQAIQDGDLLTTTTNFFFRYLKEKPNPINRPEINPATGKKYDTYYFTSANSRYNKNQNEGNAGVFKNLWERIISNLSGELPSGDYIFNNNYLQGGGITTTLKDLCKTSPESIWSVEDLMETLKKSEYITTPSKFGTIHEGSYGTQTLDSNSYWEVIVEPFCDNYLNGGYSYLPCFDEINVINAATHGVITAYNKWVPISNFELQKSKLTTKSIGLFDGEFSIPLTAELTNEIRFTIVDDQYKSWRNYFQKCMDVAVYNSEFHEDYYYRNEFYEGNSIFNNGKSLIDFLQDSTEYISSRVTPVDKSMICVALYKNITFRIRIYIMTPQYSTIRRFDLLCVLKDFVEEYSGDIDSGGVDLNVTFSIVGENPNGADQSDIRDSYIEKTYNFENKDKDFLSILPEDIDEDEWYLNHNGTSIFGG